MKQKIAGCFRSFTGAETFCRVRSFLSTAGKQGWNILNSIVYGLDDSEIPTLVGFKGTPGQSLEYICFNIQQNPSFYLSKRVNKLALF
jgi:hypothetical protein